MKTTAKIKLWVTVLLLVALGAFVYLRFYFVFGEGVKAGELNQIMYKGWVWKTYEGRLIQTGFRGAKGGGSIQSNEFDFSIVDPKLADSLMLCSGKNVELHYKEYRGSLPWRGMQSKIVDRIVSVSAAEKTTVIPVDTE